MNQFIVQGIGFVALILVVVSFQLDNRKQILTLFLLVTVLFTIHFALLGALVGSAMNLIAAIRNFFFLHNEKKWAKSKLWLYVFITLFWLSGIITFTSPLSILPIVAMTIDSFVVWSSKTKTIRFGILLPRPLWFIYNYFVGSYPGMFVEVFVTLSIFVGIFRFDLSKKNKA